MDIKLLVFGILIIVFVFAFLKIYFKEKQHSKYNITTKNIVRVGIFSAIASILYIFVKFPVPFLPPFLEFHFDEIPVFIASFAYGPVSGLFVLLIKTIIKLPFTSSLGVGELSDLIYGAVLILPAAILYKRKRKFVSVFTGLAIGFVLEIAVSLLVNIYIMIPFYMNVMEFSEEAILKMCQVANPNISDIKWSYGLVAVLPFNAIKNLAVGFLTILSYKSTHKFIDKLQN
ncbi:MAG: ECF transporter S component [Firmicutes bacterium]|nr:ECF transporter S component [Candidatus Fiminaster equi]